MSNNKGAVELALTSQLFGRFTTVERVVDVAVTAAVLLKNNPERIGYIINNTGNIQITMKLDRVVTAGEGLILTQQGDTMSTTYLEDGQFPTNELSAVAASAGGEVYVLEMIRDSV